MIHRAQVWRQLLVDRLVKAHPTARSVGEALVTELHVLEKLPRVYELLEVEEEDVNDPQRGDEEEGEDHKVDEVSGTHSVQLSNLKLVLEQVPAMQSKRVSLSARGVARTARAEEAYSTTMVIGEIIEPRVSTE